MKDVERIMRTEVLKKQIKKLYRLLDKKNQEKEKLQDECKHEIVIASCCYDQRCLFCGKRGYHYLSFEESEVIEAKDNVFGFLTSEERFEIVRHAYVQVAREHPELNTSELRKLTQEQIENSLT